MKARLCLVTSLLLLTVPAFAQEPLDQTGTEPSTEMAPSPSPSDSGQAKEPLDATGTEPSTQAAPAEDVAPPANEPLERAGTDAGQPGDQPAMVVITELSEADDDGKLVKPWNVPVDTVEEMDVYDANGKKIGEVDAVLQDKNGEVKGVVVGYGGFLGFGEKGAVVTLDQLELKDGTLVTDINEEQLSQLPEWMKN